MREYECIVKTGFWGDVAPKPQHKRLLDIEACQHQASSELAEVKAGQQQLLSMLGSMQAGGFESQLCSVMLLSDLVRQDSTVHWQAICSCTVRWSAGQPAQLGQRAPTRPSVAMLSPRGGPNSAAEGMHVCLSAVDDMVVAKYACPACSDNVSLIAFAVQVPVWPWSCQLWEALLLVLLLLLLLQVSSCAAQLADNVTRTCRWFHQSVLRPAAHLLIGCLLPSAVASLCCIQQ